MVLRLFQHYLKQIRRSPVLLQDGAQAFMLAIFALYLAVYMVLAGVLGGGFLREYLPDMPVMTGGLVALLFYFPADVLMRYFLQKYPVIHAKPYIVLPVSRAQIAHYLVLRSCLHFFNVLLLFAAVPFVLINRAEADTLELVLFCASAVCLPLLASLTVFKLEISKNTRGWWPFALFGTLVTAGLLEYNGVASIYAATAAWVQRPAVQYIWLILLVPLLAGLYVVLHKSITIALQQEPPSTPVRGGFTKAARLHGYFDPEVRPFIQLEAITLARLPRAKQYFLSGFLVLALPFSSWGEPTNEWLIAFYTFLMTGVAAMSHGQLLLSWNSTHFDLLLSRGRSVETLFRAKYYVLCLEVGFFALLSLFFVWTDVRFLWFTIAMTLINCSVSIYAYMLLAVVSSRRIEPEAGGFMSMDGFGAGHYLITIPLFAMPMALYGIGFLAGGMWGGLALLSGVGLTGVVFHKPIIRWLTRIFMKNRYQIAAAFRKTQ
jgi:hypothetical protein